MKLKTMKEKEASSECVSVQLPLAAHALIILLAYLLSGIDVSRKGFHEVVPAPLRLTSMPDILSDAEEGYPFFLFPWQLYFNVGASEHYHCHHVIYIPKAIGHSD